MYYRPFLKSDLDEYVKRASTEFKPEDFCDKAYLLDQFDKLKCFVLQDETGDWIGWCALSFKDRPYNQGGAHILGNVIFPKYRGKGYSKYLFKIHFDHAKGFQKSGCVSATNTPSIQNMLHYGFSQHGTRKIWNLYLCSADYYPEELKGIYLKMKVRENTLNFSSREQDERLKN